MFSASKLLKIIGITKRIGNFFKLPIHIFIGYSYPELALIPLQGLTLDAVWQSLVSSIGQFSVEQDKSLTEQIQADEERAKLERQIAALERQMNTTKQPRRKRELFVELQNLKGGLL